MIYLCCFVHSPSGMKEVQENRHSGGRTQGISHCVGQSEKEPQCGKKEISGQGRALLNVAINN